MQVNAAADKNVPVRAAIHVNETDDVNIDKITPLISPAILMEQLPLSDEAANTVRSARRAFKAIMSGEDDRMAVVVGPCSIHDPKAALEYAALLKPVAAELSKDLVIIMRVYFEKPRTTVGWKGLINDPNLDGTFMINKGLRVARELLLSVNEMGLPCGVEFLDVISPQFLGDLVSYGAIGARTTESQIHRELASGLSAPVGFKNGTSGDLQVCVGAIKSASAPHRFMSITKQGLAAIVTTKGNGMAHTILRGGTVTGPNFDPSSVAKAVGTLTKGGASPKVVIDCSHGNSAKDHNNQPIVADSIANQVSNGNLDIIGVMIESNLQGGNQKLPAADKLDQLQYGVSVTDACTSWEQTLPMLTQMAAAVRSRRAASSAPRIYCAKL